MINFNQLRVFHQAAKYQNFTMAAKKLFITQPAVTAQIKFLEEYCNLTLFKKRGRHIFLTEEGRTLYQYARKIFEYEKEIDNAIEDMRDLRRGTLRLGTTKTYARYFMPFLITRFRNTYPSVKIHLDEGSSRDMSYTLTDLKNELAIIAKAEDVPEVCFIPFSHEEIVPILAPDHPLALKKSIPLKALAAEPLIMKESGSGTRRLVNNLYKTRHLSPEVLMETSNTEFIKQLVQRGEGISFLVSESVAAEIRDGKLASVSLEEGKLFLDVSIAFLEDQHLSPPAQAFLNMLQKMAPKKAASQGFKAIVGEMLKQWEQGMGKP